MSENLLLELEPTPAVAVSLENIENLELAVRSRGGEVGLAVKGMKGSVVAFEKIWRRIVMAVARGETTKWHAERLSLLSAFEKRLRLLKDTHTLATWLIHLGIVDVPDPEALLAEIVGMKRLKAGVFDHWQTADDLEDLAARDYPLTAADLDAIGPHRQPPASWYAEEGKPF